MTAVIQLNKKTGNPKRAEHLHEVAEKLSRPVAGQRAHFVGIAGSGMRAMALYMHACGVNVSGSDIANARGDPIECAQPEVDTDHGIRVDTDHGAQVAASSGSDSPFVVETHSRGDAVAPTTHWPPAAKLIEEIR